MDAGYLVVLIVSVERLRTGKRIALIKYTILVQGVQLGMRGLLRERSSSAAASISYD